MRIVRLLGASTRKSAEVQRRPLDAVLGQTEIPIGSPELVSRLAGWPAEMYMSIIVRSWGSWFDDPR